MNNSMNFQPRNRSKKKKSPSGIAVMVTITSVLVVAILTLSCALIYLRVVRGYENKIEEYEAMLEQYNDYSSTIDRLNEQIIKLSSSEDGGLQEFSENESLLSPPERTTAGTVFDVASVAGRVAPAVIGIKVDVPAQNINSFWQTQPAAESGSGIIISADGYIVTNYHVVQSAVEYENAVITVVFIDGEEYTAEYIGGDEINDLAVVKIDAENLDYAELGSSDESKVGDYVIAIGNPLGVVNLYGSVTFGIISGVNRKIEAENVAEELLQTDAAINPGNSGGALINSKGEVIGINTIKISSSNYEGLGFAIPIDYAKPLISSIMEHGYVKGRPTLGINGWEITRTIASIYRLPQGIAVTGVEPDSDSAGVIIENDIITHIDNAEVYSLTDMNDIVKKHTVGESLSVIFWRNGEYFEAQVTLSEKK